MNAKVPVRTLTHTAETAVGELDDVVSKLLDSMLDIDENEREILLLGALKIVRTLRNELHLAVSIEASEVQS